MGIFLSMADRADDVARRRRARAKAPPPCSESSSSARAGQASRPRRSSSGRLLDLPVHHLDRLHWREGWVEGSREELVEALAPILAASAG
jgi:hypothetical protein